MAITLIIQGDGDGIPGATAYEDVADTSTRLADLVYAAFVGIIPESSQTALVFRATGLVDRMIKSLSREEFVRGVDDNTQGLFYPRAVSAIPDDIKLASALQAEILAIKSSVSSDPFLNLPDSFLEGEMAKGVRVKFDKGPKTSKPVSELMDDIESILAELVELEPHESSAKLEVL